MKTHPGISWNCLSRCLTLRARCSVPGSRDVILSKTDEDVLWQAFFTAAPEQRREFEPSSSVARQDQRLSPALWVEPRDRSQVAGAQHDLRCANGPTPFCKHRALAVRGSGDCGVQTKDHASARRCAWWSARDHSKAHALQFASLLGAPRHLAFAGKPG